MGARSRVSAFAEFVADLEWLRSQGQRRTLTPQTGIDFSSNDYLGLANSADLREAAREALSRQIPLGAGESGLLRVNLAERVALEMAAAAYFRTESALYFGSDFVANAALFATVPQRGDLAVHDEYIDASVHDGMRRGCADIAKARHNDVQSMDDEILRWRTAGGTGRVWLAVESVYGMDGDGPDLEELYALASRRDAVLVVDEAHATGVLGPRGRGRAAFLAGRENVVTVHTCGKALGTAGAFVCGPKILNEYLVNRGHAFIYSTASSPLITAVARAALSLSARSGARRQRLQSLVRFASRELKRQCGITASGSHIVPIVLGADEAASTLAAKLREYGYDARVIRPPTVPKERARLRISLTLNVDESAIGGLVRAMALGMREG